MARTPDLRRRRELLDAVVDECAANGVGGRSLRELADAVGTSHRMLLHHFGSRDELMLAVVDEVERRQMTLLSELMADGTGFAAMWEHLRRPELRALERLFFECYARGAQGESPFTTMLPGAVDRWLSVTVQTSLGSRGCLISNRRPIASCAPSRPRNRVTDAVQFGQCSTSVKTSHTRSAGASISTLLELIMYQMVHLCDGAHTLSA